MKTQNLIKLSVAASMGVVLALGASVASAVTIDWLNMAPTPFGSSVPNNSVYNLPGVGNVTVTYSIPNALPNSRIQNALLQNGSVTGASWTAHEMFGVTSLAPNPPFVAAPWTVTYTFPGTVAAGSLYVGVAGLGRTSSFGGGMSTATVIQNGLYLGDWTGGGNYGATQYIVGAGTFTMQNSVTGLGGADPWWNSALGVVQILDPVSSLTFLVNQLPGDGLGVNIGHVVPEPATLSLLALSGLAMLRKRRALI
jgi:hypothetical protein